MKPCNLVIVNHISPHHAKNSGMKGLLPYIPGIVFDTPRRELMPYRFRQILASHCQSSYGASSVSKELSVISYMLKVRHGLAHFLNGEPQFHYTGMVSHPLGWQTMATFHKPPDILNKIIPNKNYLKKLDAAICVGTNQLSFFENIIGSDAIFHIPLGVDTEFFTPDGPNKLDEKVILFVGQHMRDFDKLGKILLKVKTKIPHFRFIAVILPEYREFLPNLPEIEIKSGISDQELRDVYRSASLLLMPFIDSTANCSLLEAIACGLPVVTNNVGSVMDYVGDDCGYISMTSSTDEMVDMVVELLTNLDANIRLRYSARQRANSFSWQNISSLYLNIYERMLDMGHS